MRRVTFNDVETGRASSASPVERDPSQCHAQGCPIRASVDVGGAGRYFCSHHAWAQPDKWASITRAIRDLDWYTGLIGDLIRYHRAGDDKTALLMAREFWATEPDMLPNDYEARHFPQYLNRLHQDFGYRVGARLTKPAPMRPQSETFAGLNRRVRMPEATQEAA